MGVRCGICEELCKNLGCELQTSNEEYPKLKKIEKMMSKLKSLADELRAEMSKNAVVRIKRGLSPGRSNSGGICRSKETNSKEKKALFPTQPPQDQTRVSFASNGNGGYKSYRVT